MLLMLTVDGLLPSDVRATGMWQARVPLGVPGAARRRKTAV